MENILMDIRMISAVEKNLKYLQFSNLILDIWDLIGCDFKENIIKVYRIISGKEIIEDVITELKYEHTSNMIIKYHENSIFNYFVKNDNFYMITNWDYLDNQFIVKTVINEIVKNEIKNTIDLVFATPLEENNEIINDLM